MRPLRFLLHALRALQADLLRALLLEARADPTIRDEITSRNEAAALIVASDFTQMRAALPAETARLWIGLVVEVALLELSAKSALPASRTALNNITHGCGRGRTP